MNFHSAAFLLEHSRRDGAHTQFHINQRIIAAAIPLAVGIIVVLASLASGWVAAASAFVLFLGVHAMESYVLTPLIQRQALDIPPATLFAFQILLGIVFGLWGLTLALPLLAVAKVMIDYFKTDHGAEEPAAAI